MNLASLSFGERPIHFPPGGLDPRPCIVQLRIEGHRGKRLEVAEGGKGVSAGSVALTLGTTPYVWSQHFFVSCFTLPWLQKNPKT